MTYPPSPTRTESVTPGGSHAERVFDRFVFDESSPRYVSIEVDRPSNRDLADRLPRRNLAQKLRRLARR